MSLEEIITRIKEYPTRYICVTGGEPLLQDEILVLMSQLCDENFTVSLETSGDLSCSRVDPRVKKIIDIKTPDSGEPDRFHNDNWPTGTSDVNTEFKFVICTQDDFTWCENLCRKHNLFEHHIVLYSPSFGEISEKWLAKKILSENSRARLQLQLHKYIWSTDLRGV